MSKTMDKSNKVKAKLIVEVEKAIDNWKKENPDKKVTIEIPGNSITIKLSEANIYTDQAGNLYFDAE